MKRALLMLALAAALLMGLLPSWSTGTADAGEGFFQKIGDGWKTGKWVPGLPDVKPKSVQEVIWPMCWGAPQDCRGETDSKTTQKVAATIPTVSVSYRVDCRDRDTGRDRADNTVTVTAPIREDAVAQIEKLIRTTDLCQANGDLSRITKPGTGRYL